MSYNPAIHHRRSIRLKHYDYSQAGLYFVTICVNERLALFGQIVNGEMRLNDAGMMVGKWWIAVASKFERSVLHECVVMPNHFHAIIEMVGADPRVCPPTHAKPIMEHTTSATPIINIEQVEGAHMGAPLHKVVQWFKTMTTNDYIKNVKQNDWLSFNGKLWQRNYHEHIIRSECAYLNIAHYIETNPMQWQEDCYFEQ